MVQTNHETIAQDVADAVDVEAPAPAKRVRASARRAPRHLKLFLLKTVSVRSFGMFQGALLL